MTTFDQRGQMVSGNQYNTPTSASFEQMCQNVADDADTLVQLLLGLDERAPTADAKTKIRVLTRDVRDVRAGLMRLGGVE